MRSAFIIGLALLVAKDLSAHEDVPQAKTDPPSLYRQLAQMLDLADTGQSAGFSYYTPRQNHRDIELSAVDFSRAYGVWRVFEVEGRVGLFHAHGIRTDAPEGVNPDSTATGVDLGAAVRFYVLDLAGTRPVRPFLEGSAQFLYTPGTHDGFPSGGSGANGFERAGAGVLVEFGPRLALEVTYQWYAHVSNGAGVSPQNPMWNGRGGTIAVRRIL